MSKANELDALLDNSISDLDDMPEFRAFPTGAHKCVFDFGTKQIGDNQCVLINLKAVETIELENPAEDTPLKQDDEVDVVYNMSNEFGQGSLKELSKLFLIAQGKETGSLRDAFEPFRGAELVFITTSRADKKDKDKKYTGIKTVIFD